MESMEDYSEENTYFSVDPINIGYIDFKALDNFFKKTKQKGQKAVEIEDNAAIIRRLDLDNDGRLKKDEFMKGIDAQEPFSKMLIRAEYKKEVNFGKIDREAPIDQ